MTKEEEQLIADFLELLQKDKKALLKVIRILSILLERSDEIR